MIWATAWGDCPSCSSRYPIARWRTSGCLSELIAFAMVSIWSSVSLKLSVFGICLVSYNFVFSVIFLRLFPVTTLSGHKFIFFSMELVTVLFEMQRQFWAAGFDDATTEHHVDKIRFDVVENALVVGDHQYT